MFHRLALFPVIPQKKITHTLMKDKEEYLKDLTDIRSMMERSSKFMSLSGWAGAMAGCYALIAATVSYFYFGVNPTRLNYTPATDPEFMASLPGVALTGLLAMVFAVGTAILLSVKNAEKKGEHVWNGASKQVVVNMSVPILAGGMLILLLMSHGLFGLVAPLTLIFYGLALFHAGTFTFDDVQLLGGIQIALGLASIWFLEYSLVMWAFGFGVVHIVYGIYMYFRYER
jgi:hypothetical protein